MSAVSKVQVPEAEEEEELGRGTRCGGWEPTRRFTTTGSPPCCTIMSPSFFKYYHPYRDTAILVRLY